ncbi:MAG: hypothetical protein MJ081_06160 [Ruminococcus sp.]|nr:hypothetical protein [Ruminococcus sp.]
MKFTDKISADEIKKEIDAEFSKSSDKTDYDKISQLSARYNDLFNTSNKLDKITDRGIESILSKTVYSESCENSNTDDEFTVSGVEVYPKKHFRLSLISSYAAVLILLIGIGSAAWLMKRSQNTIKPDNIKPYTTEVTTYTTTALTTTKALSTTAHTVTTTLNSAETTAVSYSENNVIHTDSAETETKTVSAVTTTTAAEPEFQKPTQQNAVSVLRKKLTQSIYVNGTSVPEGAYAVNIRVDNNTGFETFEALFQLGDALTVIKNSDGRPVISKGESMSGLIVSASEFSNKLSVTGASSKTELSDGTMYTFYVLESDDTNADNSIEIMKMPVKLYTAKGTYWYPNEKIPVWGYRCGDVNGDHYVDTEDARLILTALDVYSHEEGADISKGIRVDRLIEESKHYFFPNNDYTEEQFKKLIPPAAVIGENYYSNFDSVADILYFYSCWISGEKYEGDVSLKCDTIPVGYFEEFAEVDGPYLVFISYNQPNPG